MNKKNIVINGENFSDLAGCYQEMNSLFIHGTGWKMGHSLDALNDILYGGFGVFEPGEPVVVIWQNFSKSKDDLGVAETRRYYEMKINQGYPYNIQLFKNKLKELDQGIGKTHCDIIIEIFANHKNIELRPEG